MDAQKGKGAAANVSDGVKRKGAAAKRIGDFELLI